MNPFSGKVFITYTGNHRIQVLNNDLTYSHEFGIRQGKEDGQFNKPIDIACDSCGNVPYYRLYEQSHVGTHS